MATATVAPKEGRGPKARAKDENGSETSPVDAATPTDRSPENPGDARYRAGGDK